MDAATIAVLLIAAAFFGFGMWLQLHSHRNTKTQHRQDSSAIPADAKPAEPQY